MIGPVSRILLRYLAAALVTYGFLDANTGKMIAGDSDLQAIVQVGLGAGIMLATEFAYWLAKKRDWQL